MIFLNFIYNLMQLKIFGSKLLLRLTCLLCSLHELVSLKVFLFVRLRKPLHACGSNHDVHSFLNTPENILLNVRYAMPVTDFLHKRSGLSVGKHTKVGPHVMFNLVVQPALKEVNNVRPIGEVNTCEDLTKVEGSREGTASITESVHIIPCMVGDNRNESMKVCQDFCEEKILDSVHVHIISSKVLLSKNEGHWKNEKMKQEVGTNDNSDELSERVEWNSRGQESLDGNSIRWDNSIRNFPSLTTCISLNESEKLVDILEVDHNIFCCTRG